MKPDGVTDGKGYRKQSCDYLKLSSQSLHQW